MRARDGVTRTHRCLGRVHADTASSGREALLALVGWPPRRREAHGLAGETEVAQEARDHGRRLDRGDEAETAAARAGTLERVDLEAAAHELGPRVVGAHRGVLLLGGARTRRLGGLGDDALAPLRVGGEDAVVEDEVAAGTGDESDEALDELERGEAHVAGAVGPGAADLQQDVAAREALEGVVGDGWPQEVAGDVLEAVALLGADGDAGVDVEAALGARLGTDEGAGLERHGDADAADALAPAGAAPGALGDGGLVEVGEVGELAGGRRDAAVLVVFPEAALDEEALDASLDEGGELLELLVGGAAQGVEGELAVVTLDPDTVGSEGMKVHVQVQRAPEALDDGDGAGAASGEAGSLRALAVGGEDGAQEDAQDGLGTVVVEGHAPTKPEGDAEDPLAMADVGEDAVDEIGGARGHAPAHAARTKASAFARVRDETLGAAARAAESGEAVRAFILRLPDWDVDLLVKQVRLATASGR